MENNRPPVLHVSLNSLQQDNSVRWSLVNETACGTCSRYETRKYADKTMAKPYIEV